MITRNKTPIAFEALMVDDYRWNNEGVWYSWDTIKTKWLYMKGDIDGFRI